MIFSKTIDQILAGTKTQTLRLAYAGDELVTLEGGIVAVVEAAYQTVRGPKRRTRWRVGNTYAVQSERCRPARGRFRCTYLREVPNPLDELDSAFAKAEGMPSVEAFLETWRALHRSEPNQRCWAIGIELVERGGRAVGREAAA